MTRKAPLAKSATLTVALLRQELRPLLAKVESLPLADEFAKIRDETVRDFKLRITKLEQASEEAEKTVLALWKRVNDLARPIEKNHLLEALKTINKAEVWLHEQELRELLESLKQKLGKD
jgi:hypothetical protein